MTSRPALIVEAQFEFLLSAWLISGIAPRLSHWTAALCFLAFAGISFGKAVAGVESCGCFGAWDVRPEFSCMLALAVVSALVWFSPEQPRPNEAAPNTVTPSKSTFRPVRLLPIGAALVIIGITSAWFVGQRSATLTLDGQIVGEGRIVVEPRDWKGRRFPLRDHLVTESRFERGNWIVLFFRDDCRKCAATLERLQELASPTSGVQVLVVDVNGQGEPTRGPLPFAALNPQHRWLVPTPMVVHLWHGVVESVELES
jgi:hypothetical protein